MVKNVCFGVGVGVCMEGVADVRMQVNDTRKEQLSNIIKEQASIMRSHLAAQVPHVLLEACCACMCVKAALTIVSLASLLALSGNESS